ncbi:type 2A phosphatase-associated protein 42 [Lindgomyces ingoldianus]|uniref:Type 2A phosphatase-associated protein 42 n=1 Tax=Lindgomyces ingoldianus TaxID=673940 RepID=A0ACB6R640_9PLEO|nr:type 2A phosphatase-associated protein 42 [Lindgomyces ingoldianus]KAF2473916.1 type 2A phosphatase-associated protein 42 [Lindgomyces ingoldianus]
MDDKPRSIRGLFTDADRKRQAIFSSPDSNSTSFQENLNITIATYESCLELSEQVSLFSSNETLDDVSSSDLQYMTICYQLADLVQKITGDLSIRKENLLKARGFYERFLKLLDSYDMLGKSDSRLLEAFLENKDQFSTASMKDAAARRGTKVARFREEKELKRKLEYLQQNPKVAENDEQVVRELHLANLAFMVHQTFQSLESIAQELHILSLAPPAPRQGQNTLAPDARHSERDSGDNYSDRLDPQSAGWRFSGPILSGDGKPLRPFTLLDTRQRLQKGVFRPDHNLPTMTIDEYLEEEKRRGGIIEGGGEQSGIRPEPDEDNVEKADEETMKARAWDEFTEENPKGSGNTLNRG